MKAIEVYLVIDGKGKEAINFYKEALSAEVTQVTTFKQGWPQCPDEYQDLIMNAQFNVNGIRFQLSDNNPMMKHIYGNNQSATLIFDNLEEAKTIYQKLSQDAKEIAMPLQATFWSEGYANFIDKYGIFWQINTETTKN